MKSLGRNVSVPYGTNISLGECKYNGSEALAKSEKGANCREDITAKHFLQLWTVAVKSRFLCTSYFLHLSMTPLPTRSGISAANHGPS